MTNILDNPLNMTRTNSPPVHQRPGHRSRIIHSESPRSFVVGVNINHAPSSIPPSPQYLPSTFSFSSIDIRNGNVFKFHSTIFPMTTKLSFFFSFLFFFFCYEASKFYPFSRYEMHRNIISPITPFLVH